MEQTKVLVIGGGPVGLYAANVLETKKIPYKLLEAEAVLGGQPQTLYPEKEVVDVPLYPPMPASGVVNALIHGIDKKNIILNCEVTGIKEDETGVTVETKIGQFRSNLIIIATGLGFHKPRPLGIPNEEKCSNILYALTDQKALEGKHIVIFGGGDSALDWAKQLSSLSPYVSLVHRRTEFRGNPDTIKGCKLDLYLPYVPDSLVEEGGICRNITIKNVTDSTIKVLPCDYVLVNYGQIPAPSTFGLTLSTTGFGVVTDEKMSVSKRIYVVGDCLYNPNYKKRIAPGMQETDIVIDSILNSGLV
jgi:thioredoxin reductase